MIAPASANIIARITHGIADDLLTTLCLATPAPLAIAPAMNMLMWKNPATQENIACLQQRGAHIIGPAAGEQACGDVGLGRLIEPTEILEWLENFFSKPKLLQKKVVITAGPTHEAIDPVRYITNRSSGKMGYALAKAMAQSGAQVLLISGPTTLECPPGVTRINIRSAEEMQAAVSQNMACDIFVGVAAVADYRPLQCATTKIKRNSESYALNLIKNPDILLTVANAQPRPFTVGFAAETDHHSENAKAKLQKKNLDMIVLNPVENGQGFDSEFNCVTILTRDGQTIEIPKSSKQAVSAQLTDLISTLINSKR